MLQRVTGTIPDLSVAGVLGSWMLPASPYMVMAGIGEGLASQILLEAEYWGTTILADDLLNQRYINDFNLGTLPGQRLLRALSSLLSSTVGAGAISTGSGFGSGSVSLLPSAVGAGAVSGSVITIVD